MSFECFGRVWSESKHSGTALLVQLAIADVMTDYRQAEVPMSCLCSKARASIQEVQQALQVLHDAGDINIFGGLPASRAYASDSLLIQMAPWAVKQSNPQQPRQTLPDQSYLSRITGYVYLIQCGPYYKIGHTKNISRRILQLGTQLPHKLEIIHVIATNEHESLEQEIHSKFAQHRLNGEWFALAEGHIDIFRHYGCIENGVLDERRNSHVYIDGKGFHVPESFPLE